MKKFKKYCYQISGILMLGFLSSSAFAQKFYYNVDGLEHPTTDLAKDISNTSVRDSNGILGQLLELFNLSNAPWYSSTSTAITYVKWIVNVALTFVSLISLILVIYGFYLMFFSKDEEGFSNAKSILKGVAIALVIMGLSWLIVSFFFSTQQQLTP